MSYASKSQWMTEIRTNLHSTHTCSKCYLFCRFLLVFLVFFCRALTPSFSFLFLFVTKTVLLYHCSDLLQLKYMFPTVYLPILIWSIYCRCVRASHSPIRISHSIIIIHAASDLMNYHSCITVHNHSPCSCSSCLLYALTTDGNKWFKTGKYMIWIY